MLIFLPERIYEVVKDKPEYLEVVQKIEDYIDKDNCSLSKYAEKIKYSTDTAIQLLTEYRETVKSLLWNYPLYIEEFDILDSQENAEEELLSLTRPNDNLEKTLFLYYYAISNTYRKKHDIDMTIELINKYIDYVKNAPAEEKFSDRIYIKFIQYKWFLKRQEICDKVKKKKLKIDIGFNEFLESMYFYLDFYTKKFNLTTDSSYQVLQHKIIQEMENFINDIVIPYWTTQKTEYTLNVAKKINEIIKTTEFKYQKFNYFRLNIAILLFDFYFDSRNFQLAKLQLSEIIYLINECYSNIEEGIDALVHHNFVFPTQFLCKTMATFILIEHFITNCPFKIIKENIPEDDLRIFHNDNLPVDFCGYQELISTKFACFSRYGYTHETLKIFDEFLIKTS